MSKEYEELDKKITELDGKVDELTESVRQVTEKMVYDYIDENMPAWARPTIQKMKDKGLLLGDEEGRLGLTDELLRIFVVNDRAGVYDLAPQRNADTRSVAFAKQKC